MSNIILNIEYDIYSKRVYNLSNNFINNLFIKKNFNKCKNLFCNDGIIIRKSKNKIKNIYYFNDIENYLENFKNYSNFKILEKTFTINKINHIYENIINIKYITDTMPKTKKCTIKLYINVNNYCITELYILN